ncbi:hypothetical protein ACSBR2_033564 [Camellia fascicularis]
MSSVEAALGEEELEDTFHRLLDNIVLHIFNMLLDAKCLCRCFLVSKRFSSLTLQVHTLFISSSISSHFNFYSNLYHLLHIHT